MQRILLLAALLAMGTATRAEHRGRVFEDRNADGLFNKGDRPMKGVKVSDGLNVTETDAQGRFTLPGHERERFVFVTTPSGYRTTDKHYHPVAAGTADYDFALQRFEGRIGRKGEHRFIHIADTEIFNTKDHEDWISNLRDYAAAEKVAFIMHTGDICYENGLKAHIELMNSKNMDCPTYYCIGNHDLVRGRWGEELFESLYGPVYYSFDVGGTHYVVTPMGGGDYRPRYTTTDVCRWLKNDLAHVAKGTPVVVFNHDLLTYGDRFVYKGGQGEEVDLNAHNLKAWVYGHWHINYLKRQGEVLTVSTATLDKGGIDHSTSAFRVLENDAKGNLTSHLHYTYIDRHICIAAPGDTLAPGLHNVTVNAYTSGALTKNVSYTCLMDGKPVAQAKALTRRTDWSWTAPLQLPENCAGHTLTLRAEAVFANGEKAEQERTLVCTAAKPAVQATANVDNLLGTPTHAAAAQPAPLPPLRMAWAANVGANLFMCSPLVHDGKVYVASVDEDMLGCAHIYALNAADGSPCWKYRVRSSVKNSIAITAGIVFAQDAEGWLYAVDAATGALRWEKKLQVGGLPSIIEGLTAADGRVYAGTGRGFCALEAATGKELWTNSEWPQDQGATSTPTLTDDGVVVMGTQWGELYGNDMRTGRMLWRTSRNGLSNRGASPAAVGGRLYLISAKAFFILDARTGETIVRRDFDFGVDVTSTPLLTGGLIVFGTTADGLMAIDRETLETKWTTRTGDAFIYTAPYTRKPGAAIETSPVAAGNTIYTAGSDGTLYALNAADGHVTWKYALGAPVFGTPALSGNTLFVTDFGGNVYAFTADGKPAGQP